ncbi:hypothetical protein [Streptomyces sp. TLI_171]|uniref:hypothetical protein n=1 Tax=Streptomyces sp. TLI_171 TaxID=1938859 RepID=UPI000C1843C1|nr:hypothetical protein [Streptomyces sp. TLI_171]RKE16929.1 hypothetical protein BX266_0175 [Streptomyces sp. TLI_171]
MIKPLAVLTGAAALSVAATIPATAAGSETPQTTTVCSPSGLQAGLATKVCAERTGEQVRIYGTVGLAGPPSPGTPWPPQQQLLTTLGADSPAGTLTGNVVFTGSTRTVGDLTGTVACDGPIRASFAVASYPWAPNPVHLDAVVPC